MATELLPKRYRQMAFDLRVQMENGETGGRNDYTGDRYCVHGTNVGNPYGADLMCGYCENGTSPYVYSLYVAHREYRRDRRYYAQRILAALRDVRIEGEGIPVDVFTGQEWSDMLDVPFRAATG